MLQNLKFYDLQPSKKTFTNEVLAGLLSKRKKLPSSLLYDETGSQLFEQICEQEDYYVTRTEIGILRKYGADIARFLSPTPFIFEFGAGNNEKIRLLLEHIRGEPSYMAVDISREHLYKSCEKLARDLPHVKVFAVCADFHSPPPFPPDLKEGTSKVFFFPGSTIGNINPIGARRLMGEIRSIVGDDGAAIVGVDLKKDPELLYRAYNDAMGVTSKFELNVLRRLNDELGANFDLDGFRYLGTYNQHLGKVEMYLVSNRQQYVRFSGHNIAFKRGETIHIEDSYKYSVEDFQDLARNSGFATTMTWLDPRGWYSMNLLLP